MFLLHVSKRLLVQRYLHLSCKMKVPCVIPPGLKALDSIYLEHTPDKDGHSQIPATITVTVRLILRVTVDGAFAYSKTLELKTPTKGRSPASSGESICPQLSTKSANGDATKAI